MKTTFLTLMIIAVTCCSPSNSRQNEIKAREKEATIKALMEKYGINDQIRGDYSSLNLYTIDSNKYMKSKYQILTDFSIHDFYEKDSIKYVKIVSIALFIKMQLELKLTDENYELFRKNDDNFYNSSIIVYSVSALRKADFIITALAGPDPSKYEDFDENYFSVSLADSGIDNLFLVNGKLIELVVSE